jgi:hypothetical protein
VIARLDVLCRSALVICGLEKRSAYDAAVLLGIDQAAVEGACCDRLSLRRSLAASSSSGRMIVQLCTTDSGPRSQLGIVVASRHQGLGISVPAPLPVMPASASIVVTKAMPVELEWGALAGILFSRSPQPLESCSICSPNHDGSIGFDIASAFSIALHPEKCVTA